ncbi:unnamed protein product [Durusdinium trenchii]|uniref:EF-hand domain-containing protein n=1 Tax=Durusdinium trenchii TaxID=1381693 RepID=A0ABP0JH01_9DINO
MEPLPLSRKFCTDNFVVVQAPKPSSRDQQARLSQILANPKVAAYFATLELDISEGRALFHLLDNGNGEVTQDEFISGILRCKGQARAIEQVAMHSELRILDHKITKLLAHIRQDASKDPRRRNTHKHLQVFRFDMSAELMRSTQP